MSTYTLHADFENIDSPELIAASLFILQNDGWGIKDYNDVSLKAEKRTVGNQLAELSVSISKTEVSIESKSDLAEQANQHIADSFAQLLHKFVSSPSFDNDVRNLKHRYFMNDPLETMKEESRIESDPNSLASFFKFTKYFRVTPAIIIINVLVLLIMVITGINFMMPQADQILLWGGVNRSMVLEGDWWRLLTSCFLHYGIIHLGFNMWALYNIGFFLERMIGSWRFLFAYIIAGLAGGLNSIIWHPYGAGAGASGAIFGMFGLFLALLTTNILEKGFRTSMLRSVVPMILFNLLIGTAGQIDNAAHIGGMLAGAACGYLFAWNFKNPRNNFIRVISFVVPVVLIVSSAFIIDKKLPDTYTAYQKIMVSIDALERDALKVEKQTNFDAKVAIKLWDKAIVEIKKAQDLNMPGDVALLNERLLFYLEKRKQEAALLNNETVNALPLKQVQTSIDSVLKVMNTKEE